MAMVWRDGYQDLMPAPHELSDEFAFDQPASGFTESTGSESEFAESTDLAQDTTAPSEPDRESLRRALRDLQAAEARVIRTADRVYDESRARLVHEILPVLDDLDRTIRATEQRSDPTLLDGVRMVRAELERVLFRFGVERVDATGVRFDPALHDAIDTIVVDEPALDGMVVNQVEPGYSFNGRLLRAARVIVGIDRTD